MTQKEPLNMKDSSTKAENTSEKDIQSKTKNLQLDKSTQQENDLVDNLDKKFVVDLKKSNSKLTNLEKEKLHNEITTKFKEEDRKIHPKKFDDDNLKAFSFILQRQKISEIPYEINSIVNLRSINLQTNLVRSMDMLSKIKTLEFIDLSDNLIEKIAHLQNTVSLDLGYNLLSKIENIEDNDTLQHLYLMANDIKEIKNLPKNLITVDIACNNILKIENLSHLVHLEELYLGNNEIKFVEPNQLETLTKCHTLSLQGNDITTIDCQFLPPNLQNLCLSENKNLKLIKNLSILKSLVYLDVWRTEVQDLESETVEISR